MVLLRFRRAIWNLELLSERIDDSVSFQAMTFKSYITFAPPIEISRNALEAIHEIFSGAGYRPTYAAFYISVGSSIERAVSIMDVCALAADTWETSSVLMFTYEALNDPPDLHHSEHRYLHGQIGAPAHKSQPVLSLQTSGFDQMNLEMSPRRLSYLKEIEKISLGLMHCFSFETVVIEDDEGGAPFAYHSSDSFPSEPDTWPIRPFNDC